MKPQVCILQKVSLPQKKKKKIIPLTRQVEKVNLLRFEEGKEKKRVAVLPLQRAALLHSKCQKIL